MPVAFVQEFAIRDGDTSTTNYDAVAAELNAQEAPDGGLIHTAGFDHDAGVFRIFDVWETREQAERFVAERVMPVVHEVTGGQPNAVPPAREYFYELHDLMVAGPR